MSGHGGKQLPELIYHKRFLLSFYAYFIHISYQTFVEVDSVLHATEQ